MKKVLSVIMFSALLFTISCSVEEQEQEQEQIEQNVSDFSKRPQVPIWADCDKYIGIIVPATFKPKSHSFDNLYAVLGEDGNPTHAFKDGLPLISDSRPGDQDYNGGRWHMYVLKEGVDTSKYANACNEMDLDLEDFVDTGNYFECPLLPYKD